MVFLITGCSWECDDQRADIYHATQAKQLLFEISALQEIFLRDIHIHISIRKNDNRL